MTKQVRETNAGQSISAHVVLNKKGEHVATVQAHYSNGSTVTVDVWQESVALDNCCKRADLWAKLPAGKDYKSSAWELWHLQQGRAGGGGYDKYAAALAGLIIDGHTIANHCGQVPEAEKARASLLKRYWADMHASPEHATPDGYKSAATKQKEWDAKARKIGARFANWRTETNSYGSLHFEAGLDRLVMLGYRVIQAI